MSTNRYKIDNKVSSLDVMERIKERRTMDSIREFTTSEGRGQSEYVAELRPMKATQQGPSPIHSSGVARTYIKGLHDSFIPTHEEMTGDDEATEQMAAIANDCLGLVNTGMPTEGMPVGSNGAQLYLSVHAGSNSSRGGVWNAGVVSHLRSEGLATPNSVPGESGVGAGGFKMANLNFTGGSAGSASNSTYRSRNSPGPPTPAQQAAADHLGVSYQVIQAIEAVESGGQAAAVRFEPHLWHRKYSDFGLTEAQRDQMPFTRNNEVPFSKVASETNEAAFNKAMGINAALAVYSTSFGLYQVMGYNFDNYEADAASAVARFRADPEGVSYELLLKWFDANPAAVQAAKDLDFMLLARHYNGPANVDVYGPRMAREYAAFSGTESVV